MCGIAGVIGRRPTPDQLARTAALMEPRGPDSFHTHEAELRGVPVTLLFRRLSIIDLAARSDQPFRRDDVTLLHNGEIYNYLELRAELERAGHRFSTESDTEVLLEAYREWGPSCVEHLEGMWAFALLDEGRGQLVLSRDRFGEKPLFTMWHDGALHFASQVGFLASLSGHRPEPDLDRVTRFLVNGYKALHKEPGTWFHGVEELPPASVAVLTGPDRPDPKPYWQLTYEPAAMSLDEAVEGARERLFESVRLRLRADVPLAVCLSGGVDSGSLAAITAAHLGHQVHGFSIVDADPRYNERDNIDQVVAHLGIDHHVTNTSTTGFFERLADLVACRAAPVTTLSAYVHSFLSEAIAAAGYRVAISGNAADELYTGYYDHYAFWLAEMHGRPEHDALLADWRRTYGRHVRNPVLQDPLVFTKDPEERGHIYLNADVFESYLTRPFHEPFSEAFLSTSLLRNRLLNEIRYETVPVLLEEDDYNSMRYSVENRAPFLDRSLAEFLFTVPPEHLVVDGRPKWLLRAAVEGLLPDAVRLDTRKRGFNASVDSLIDRTDPATVDRLLADGPIFDLVRREAIEAMLTADLTDNSFSKFVFSFVSARTFLDQQVA